MTYDALEQVLAYHHASKHHLDRYAPGPGYLDWDSQPAPFREYADAPRLALPLDDARLPRTSWPAVRAGRLPPAVPPTVDGVSALLRLSLGLSAWKVHGDSRWALRCNPSSGNLHPTEGYVVAPPLPGLAAGVYHYLSREHALEQRAALPDAAWPAGGDGFLLALTGIAWREAWKYGMRAFRYCQHDAGHALAAVSLAAAALGWATRPVAAGDATLARLLGLDCTGADAAEQEQPELLVWLGSGAVPELAPLLRAADAAAWHGRANRLSAAHRAWPEIDAVGAASTEPDGASLPVALPRAVDAPAAEGSPLFARLALQRRSAVDFDGRTSLPAADFFRLLSALLPRDAAPWVALGQPPAVHLVLFVHRVDGLAPGLYLLQRAGKSAASPESPEALRPLLRPEWMWEKAGPDDLPLWLLLPADLRGTARTLCCHQDIAADGCFALGMLADFERLAPGGTPAPWHYRHLYRECGAIGQMLYLEAEAVGLRGTGIGCFFDDAVHRALGLADDGRWQSLYHFTVGGAVEDGRLSTLPPYVPRAA